SLHLAGKDKEFMKKSTIWLLTVIMALTFAGLLYMQIMYMENMIKMRDDQFAESVKRSLYSVTQMLVKDETSHYLEKELVRLQVGTTYAEYAGTPPQVDGVTLRFTTKSGIETDLSIKGDAENIVRLQTPSNGVLDHYKSMQEVLKGQYLYHKGLADQLILSIMTQSSNRPIEERADSTTVRRYLKNEFENNGIDLPFEFAVVNKSGRNVYTTNGFTSLLKGDNNMFVQTLFPNDPSPRINYLKVYFPDKQKFLLSSIKLIIPTFIFTFILFCTFVYTIVIAFRQKKLTEMKNDFINNMTHEFKTPISSISLAAQMLNDDSVRKSPNMLQHISTVIMDETKRLRFQVEKVLQMSMFDRHKTSLRLQDVDANQAI
ncbi:MAG: two-component sensor histidine kinase, partial [Muribaculaceae bacterium]|nr:two-component sensor histidine kinase [Muribaculaceae bacterium]